MENASLVGLSRQIALQRELDVVANNVANLNTTGFKADNVVFHEHLMPVARANHVPRAAIASSASCRTAPPGSISRRARCSRPAIRSTSRSATTPSSRCRRRAANATRATARCRSTAPASSSPPRACRCIGQNGPIVFQPNDRNVSISTDGTISVREGQQHHRLAARQAAPRDVRAAAAAAEGRHLDLHGAGRRAGADAAPTARVVQGVDREVERARRRRDDPHGRGDAHLHPGRQHAAAAERHAAHGDREARRSPERAESGFSRSRGRPG